MLWVVGAPARLFALALSGRRRGWRSASPRPAPSGWRGITDFARPVQATTTAPGWQPPTASSRCPRRLVRPGHRRQPAEVGRPARGAHRLHLRRASARSSAWSAPCSCSALFVDHRLRRPSGSRCSTADPFVRYMAAGDRGLAARPDDDQHRHGARRCCRSSASRCRWCPTAAPRCCRRWSRSACWSASPGASPRPPRGARAAARRGVRPAAARAAPRGTGPCRPARRRRRGDTRCASLLAGGGHRRPHLARCSPPPTRCAGCDPDGRDHLRSARRAAWRPGSSRPPATRSS